ncbi:MAG TPA: choice-of-anchor Q domain-containing protein [Herpetosiphonaceae bacterium]|nr:choice-of-anchor Q domain-containing protein [Herpetosiphonaceae bacterium]
MISTPRWVSRFLSLAALALLASALPSRPALARAPVVVYVVPGGAGSRTGADWSNARDLQPALLAASAGSELWVKAGTYAPASAADPGFYQGAAFQLKSGVALYGGFAGDETARSQRDARANPTVLSGDLLGNDSGAIHAGNPTRADNSRNVVRAAGTDASAILDGFAIAGGTAAGNYLYGGGIDINSGGPTISNVVFHDNFGTYGGALAVRGQSSPRIAFARFYRNFAADKGGALYSDGGATLVSQAVLSGNSAPPGGDGTSGGRGGALFVAGGSVTLSHSSLVGNVAGSGSAIYLSQGVATLANSIVWGNLGGQFHGSVAASHSLLQGGYPGTNVISADPLFVDADGADDIVGTADDDLRLRPESPAIDAGSDALIGSDFNDADGDGDAAEPTPLDLAGNPRRSGPVDLGAYEAPMGPRGDFLIYLPAIVR